MPIDTINASQEFPPATSEVPDDARSLKAAARIAGILYVVMAMVMIVAFMYVPSMFIVSGDATATARNITDRTFIYRLGLLGALTSHILFILVVLMLYNLFKNVDRKQARLMAALVLVGVAVELANLLNRAAPLVLLSGADFLAPFTKAQLDALAFTFIRFGNTLGQIAIALWGLWLIPFGTLTIKSGFFPKIFGILLYVAGFAYLIGCITNLVFPNYMGALSPFLFPLYMGELGIVLWMAVMGAKAPERRFVS